MKSIIKRFKSFILRMQIRKCNLKDIASKAIIGRYSDKIHAEIWSQNREEVIEKLQLMRSEVFDKRSRKYARKIELELKLKRVS